MISYFISVIIPVLNNKSGFTKALASLPSPSENNIQTIVIDGGSTDGTLSVIIENNGVIDYWESGNDSGICDAFNRGILKSTGKFIVILNSDDYWEPDAFNAFSNSITENPRGDIYYGAIRFFEPVSGYNYIRKPYIENMKYRMSLFHPAMLIRRETYMRIGLYNPDYTHAMDSEWCHRAISSGESFIEIPFIIANMSLGGISDREYNVSLSQYRDSIIFHKLSGAISANIYFMYFLLAKNIMRYPFMFNFKKIRDFFIK
jgi:glycosyltransferase involved in cell wall biosynthesis